MSEVFSEDLRGVILESLSEVHKSPYALQEHATSTKGHFDDSSTRDLASTLFLYTKASTLSWDHAPQVLCTKMGRTTLVRSHPVRQFVPFFNLRCNKTIILFYILISFLTKKEGKKKKLLLCGQNCKLFFG